MPATKHKATKHQVKKPQAKKGSKISKPKVTPRHSVEDLLDFFNEILEVDDQGFLAANVLMEVYHDFSNQDKFKGFLNYNSGTWGKDRQPYKEQALIALLFLVVPKTSQYHAEVIGLSTTLSSKDLSRDQMLNQAVTASPIGNIVRVFLGYGQYDSRAHAKEDEAALFATLNRVFGGQYESKAFKVGSPETKNWYGLAAERLGLPPVMMEDNKERQMLWCIVDVLPPLNQAAVGATSPPVTYFIDPSLVAKFDPGQGHSSKNLSRGQARAKESGPQTLNFFSPAPRTFSSMATSGLDGSNRSIDGKFAIALYSPTDGRLLASRLLGNDDFAGGQNPNQISAVMEEIRARYGNQNGDFDQSKCVTDEEKAAEYLLPFRRKALGDGNQSHYCDALVQDPIGGLADPAAPPLQWGGHGFLASKANPSVVRPYEGTNFDGAKVNAATPGGFGPLVPKGGPPDNVIFRRDLYGVVYLTVDLLSGALGALHSCSITCVNTHKRIVRLESSEGVQSAKRRQEQIIRDTGHWLFHLANSLEGCGFQTQGFRKMIRLLRANKLKAAAVAATAMGAAAASAGVFGGSGKEEGLSGPGSGSGSSDSGDTPPESTPVLSGHPSAPGSGADSGNTTLESTPEQSRRPSGPGSGSDSDEVPQSTTPEGSGSSDSGDANVDSSPEESRPEESRRTPESGDEGKGLPSDRVPSPAARRLEFVDDEDNFVKPAPPVPTQQVRLPLEFGDEGKGLSSDKLPSPAVKQPALDDSGDDNAREVRDAVGSQTYTRMAVPISGRGVERITVVPPSPGRLGDILVETEHGDMRFSQRQSTGDGWSPEEKSAIVRFFCQLADREQLGYEYLSEMNNALGDWAKSTAGPGACPPVLMETMDEAIDLSIEAENLLGTIYVSEGDVPDESSMVSLSDVLKAIRSAIETSARGSKAIRSAIETSARGSQQLGLEVVGQKLGGGSERSSGTRKRCGKKGRKQTKRRNGASRSSRGRTRRQRRPKKKRKTRRRN